MKTRRLTAAALFAALMALCAWLQLPTGAVPVTLQTLGLFLCLQLLGGKWGSVAIFVYLCLGILGLPVFSGFQGGLGTLAGPTGGCLVGFMLTALTYWAATRLLPRRPWTEPVALLAGLLLCYLSGWLWYRRFGPVSFGLWCLPYLLPDLAKLVFSWFLAQRLKRHNFSF